MHEYRILNFVHAFINDRDKLLDILISYFVQKRYIHYCDKNVIQEENVTYILLAWQKLLPNNIRLINSNKFIELG